MLAVGRRRQLQPNERLLVAHAATLLALLLDRPAHLREAEMRLRRMLFRSLLRPGGEADLGLLRYVGFTPEQRVAVVAFVDTGAPRAAEALVDSPLSATGVPVLIMANSKGLAVLAPAQSIAEVAEVARAALRERNWAEAVVRGRRRGRSTWPRCWTATGRPSPPRPGRASSARRGRRLLRPRNLRLLARHPVPRHPRGDRRIGAPPAGCRGSPAPTETCCARPTSSSPTGVTGRRPRPRSGCTGIRSAAASTASRHSRPRSHLRQRTRRGLAGPEGPRTAQSHLRRSGARHGGRNLGEHCGSGADGMSASEGALTGEVAPRRDRPRSDRPRREKGRRGPGRTRDEH